jgi:glycosyltransferase involved in cell wall biosynthesis
MMRPENPIVFILRRQKGKSSKPETHSKINLKVLHIAYHDRKGGASIAAYRQHQSLQRNGIDSQMLVKFKVTQDASVSAFQASDNAVLRLKRLLLRKWLGHELEKARPTAPFAMARADIGSELLPRLKSVDLINLQFAWGFADYPSLMELLPPEVPVVVTMHGLENFTGGCSYTQGCTGFERECGNCPQLKKRKTNDLSKREWNLRSAAFNRRKQKKLHFVADSHWMAKEASRSSLLRNLPVSVIYYGIDTEIFRPLDRTAARSVFNIPPGVKVISFAADSVSDPRKGMTELSAALAGMKEKPFLLTWGRDRHREFVKLGGLHLGYVESEHLGALAYNASDVFVMPSREEAFGQTALESIACGTPVAAFAAGGIPEVVRDGATGLLAKPGQADELRQNILRLLADEGLRQAIGKTGVKTAHEEFSFAVHAARYLDLYRSMVKPER